MLDGETTERSQDGEMETGLEGQGRGMWGGVDAMFDGETTERSSDGEMESQ